MQVELHNFQLRKSSFIFFIIADCSSDIQIVCIADCVSSTVLNNLLYEGVRVKSLTYSMLRWVRNRDHFLRRKAAGLPIVEEHDFYEINDLRLSVGLHPVRDL